MTKNHNLTEDLLQDTLVIFLTHKNSQEIVNTGAAFFYCLRISMNLWKSETSPFYKKYKYQHEELSEIHEEIPDEEYEFSDETLDEIFSIVDNLSWYENMLLKEYADVGQNALKLSRLTGIPRTSISLSIKRIQKHIQTKLTKNA